MRAAASAFTFSLFASASVPAFSAAAEASSARVFTLSYFFAVSSVCMRASASCARASASGAYVTTSLFAAALATAAFAASISAWGGFAQANRPRTSRTASTGFTNFILGTSSGGSLPAMGIVAAFYSIGIFGRKVNALPGVKEDRPAPRSSHPRS